MHEPHWASQLALYADLGLCLLISYLVIRTLLMRTCNLASAPSHIQESISIVKWIAAFAVLTSLLATAFFLFDELRDMYIDGRYDGDRIMPVVGEVLTVIAYGVLTSTTAMLGIALLFVQKLWQNKS